MKKEKSKRTHWKVIYKGPVDQFDSSESVEYWSTRSVEEKFKEVEALIDQAELIKGKPKGERRLLRSTAVIRRL